MSLVSFAWRNLKRYTNLEMREWYRLRGRLSKFPRYQPTEVDLLGYHVHLVDSMSFLSMYRQIFVNQSHWFLARRPSPFILACGANIGLSVINFKRLYANSRIIAFEPDPEICRVLRRNVEINHLPNVEVIEAAVWTHSGGISFVADRADGGRVDLSERRDGVTVPSVRLHDYLDTPVDLLKLDIEGAEGKVLFDCADRLKNVQMLILEYHGFAHREQEFGGVLDLLRAQGFRYYVKVEQPWLNPSRPIRLHQDIKQILVVYAASALDIQYSSE